MVKTCLRVPSRPLREKSRPCRDVPGFPPVLRLLRLFAAIHPLPVSALSPSGVHLCSSAVGFSLRRCLRRCRYWISGFQPVLCSLRSLAAIHPFMFLPFSRHFASSAVIVQPCLHTVPPNLSLFLKQTVPSPGIGYMQVFCIQWPLAIDLRRAATRHADDRRATFRGRFLR